MPSTELSHHRGQDQYPGQGHNHGRGRTTIPLIQTELMVVHLQQTSSALQSRVGAEARPRPWPRPEPRTCLLYTSDAADDM
eukprot:13244600-Alexandrium_andersonii.AAC.1